LCRSFELTSRTLYPGIRGVLWRLGSGKGGEEVNQIAQADIIGLKWLTVWSGRKEVILSGGLIASVTSSKQARNQNVFQVRGPHEAAENGS
jgi:hypothetical protein